MGEQHIETFYSPSKTCQIPGLSAIYEEIFGQKTDGTFCEVGGYDGESFSNTSCLADKGWRGLYIEPVPQFADACAIRHADNNVLVVQRCAGEPGTVTLHLGGGLTTTKEKHVEAYNEIHWAKGVHKGESIQANQDRLDTLLAKAGFEPNFDVLVVDVEGSEPDVFKTFDLYQWLPKVMIVELEDEHPSFQAYDHITGPSRQLRGEIHKAGYVEKFRDSINTIFLRKDIQLGIDEQ